MHDAVVASCLGERIARGPGIRVGRPHRHVGRRRSRDCPADRRPGTHRAEHVRVRGHVACRLRHPGHHVSASARCSPSASRPMLSAGSWSASVCVTHWPRPRPRRRSRLIAAGPEMTGLAAFSAWLAVLFSTLGGLLFVLGFIFPTGRPCPGLGPRSGSRRSLRRSSFSLDSSPDQARSRSSPRSTTRLAWTRPATAVRAAAALTIAATAALIAPVLVWLIVSRFRMADEVGRQQLKWFIVSVLRCGRAGSLQRRLRLSSPIDHRGRPRRVSGSPAPSSRSRSG